MLQLDLQYFAGEKTEKATPKKRQDTRKKGQVAKSQDVNTAIIMLFVFLSFLFLGGFLLDRSLAVFTTVFGEYMLWELTEASAFTLFLEFLQQFAWMIVPVMLVAFVAAVIGNYIQVGVLFAPESIKMKLEKLDPIKGAKRIFSWRALVELAKSFLKITLIGVVTFAVLWLQIDEVLQLSLTSLGDIVSTLGLLTLQMGLAGSVVLIVLAVFDYLYQRFDHEKNIRMSKQDLKDEYKNTEGDPLIKSRIKQRQREMATRRMMQEVPDADVVITNPTHFAIVLKYDEEKSDAPYVVAKGADFLAQKIKRIASENKIEMVENRPLARSLYESTEIGQPIPEEFFKAVAEILAYVYQTNNKTPRRNTK
ncbi:flagellar biosynthesis protein FlhB [Bacillus fonticola]|uniref:flagellar biosynthesis protein FlhB n=1 Tax=Bacillus fonticola TaxID=2728853 RepID=UPI001473ED87|nr:flagellar biosynthesis protein FlhB [Bacillus fonticola]